MSKRKLAVTTLLMTAGLIAGAAGVASAHEGPHPAPAPAGGQAPSGTASDAVFFAATLNGRNEVPVAGGPAVGDKDGKAKAVVRIQGNQICFTSTYANLDAPTAGHIHAGAAGTNGAVKVAFFASPLPESVRAFTGCVGSDAATVEAIKANPESFYVNLHSAQFPGGAVRGQLRKLDKPVDLLAPLRGSLVGLMDGGQETPDLGDGDGRATGFARARGDKVDYAFTWSGIAPPTLGHIHAGKVGVAGDVAVPLFAAEGGLPASVTGIAGTVEANPDVVRGIARRPGDFYFNLHNAEFGKGAVRGQLFRAAS